MGRLNALFIPPEINSLVTSSKAKRGKYPVGVYFKKDAGIYRAQLAVDGGYQKMLIETPNVQEAFDAYKTEKEKYIKTVASRWAGKVDQRIIDALNSWEIKETD